MRTAYRALVTASRGMEEVDVVEQALTAEWQKAGHDRPFIVVHGNCKTGGDRFARNWALAREGFGVVNEPHDAIWRRNGTFDPSAGPRRNAHMVSLGAHVCLAFIGPCTSGRCTIHINHPSHGASGCADLARRHGIRVEPFPVGGLHASHLR